MARGSPLIMSDTDNEDPTEYEYVYLEDEIMPDVEIEFEGQNHEIIGVDAYENMMDQIAELGSQNWQMQYKCRDFETRLKILKRSVPQKVRDRVRYWKKVAIHYTNKAKRWAQRFGIGTNKYIPYNLRPRYDDMLMAHYYPPISAAEWDQEQDDPRE